MSKFAERLNDVMEAGDTLIITRAYEGEEKEFLSIEFRIEDTEFGALKQVEYIDATKVTPGKLIKTIEAVKKKIRDAVETIQGAQTPPGE